MRRAQLRREPVKPPRPSQRSSAPRPRSRSPHCFSVTAEVEGYFFEYEWDSIAQIMGPNVMIRMHSAEDRPKVLDLLRYDVLREFRERMSGGGNPHLRFLRLISPLAEEYARSLSVD